MEQAFQAAEQGGPGFQQAQTALFWSEMRFRSLVENSADVFVLLDQKGTILYESPSVQSVLGFSPEELVGHNCLELAPPEERDRLAGLFIKLLDKPDTVLIEEFRHLHKDGSERWLEGAASNLLGDPAVKAIVFNCRDVTRRRRMEEALRQSEGRLRRLTETLPAVPWSTDTQGMVEFFSDKWLDWTGLSREQALGAGWRRVVHPEDLPAMEAAVSHSIRTGEPFSFELRMHRLPGGDYRWYRSSADPERDAAGRIVRWHGITYDIHELKTALDAKAESEKQLLEREERLRLALDARKLGEEALQQQNRRLGLLSQATANLLLAEEPGQIVAGIAQRLPQRLAVDGILEFELAEEGEELQLKGCWGEGQEMLEHGWSRMRLGEGLSGGVAQERRPRVLARTQPWLAAEPGLTRNLGIKAYACYPLIVGERLLGTLTFASRRRESYERQDLQFLETLAGHVALAVERQRLTKELRRHTEGLERTVAERTAELSETVQELEHFSYSLLHDMRAPLRAMIGFATMAEREYAGVGPPPAALDYLKRIQASSERMDHLVRDALNYTRVLHRHFALRPVALLPLLEGLVESYPELWPHQREIHLSSALPVVLGNEAVLTECFSNLLRNAVKFMAPCVTPRVRVWAETIQTPKPQAQSQQTERDTAEPSWSNPEREHALPKTPPPSSLERYVRIWVEDNGIGIPRDAHEKIFTMFWKLHKPEIYPGTGIGLAIVRKGLERIGGRVGVESEEGEGSRFWLELKAVPG